MSTEDKNINKHEKTVETHFEKCLNDREYKVETLTDKRSIQDYYKRKDGK